ncbi:hypothetical protein [Hydrogeniiclostridium mannosilyticum]
MLKPPDLSILGHSGGQGSGCLERLEFYICQYGICRQPVMPGER